MGGRYILSFYVGRASGNSLYATPSAIDVPIDGGSPTTFTNSNSIPGTVQWTEFSTVVTATGSITTIAFRNSDDDQ